MNVYYTIDFLFRLLLSVSRRNLESSQESQKGKEGRGTVRRWTRLCPLPTLRRGPSYDQDQGLTDDLSSPVFGFHTSPPTTIDLKLVSFYPRSLLTLF